MPVGPKDGGYETFGDKLIGPFTAHPKFDPETGEMIFFGYSATGRFTKEISIQTVTEDGIVTRAEMLDGVERDVDCAVADGVHAELHVVAQLQRVHREHRPDAPRQLVLGADPHLDEHIGYVNDGDISSLISIDNRS